MVLKAQYVTFKASIDIKGNRCMFLFKVTESFIC